jgi:ribosomal-protein-alanine N-acetyltransferase
MIAYRAMSALDIPVVVSLERAIFKVDPWSVAQFKEEIAAVGKNRHYLVAEVDNEIVAYAGACVIAKGEVGDIHTLAVIPEFRAQGIGRHLLTELITWIEGQGAPAVMLEMRTGNVEAEPLYRSFGFEFIRTRKSYYAPGVDAVVMRKDFTVTA